MTDLQSALQALSEKATQELLPCPNPWCEGPEREGDFSPVAYRRQYGNWAVGCTSCPMDGPIRSTEAEAITAWNRRTGHLTVADPADIAGEVTQADREAAHAHDLKVCKGKKGPSLEEAFSRHRIAAIAAAEARGRAAERADVVRWVRTLAGYSAEALEGHPPRGEVWVLHRSADAIEAGKHLAKESGQ